MPGAPQIPEGYQHRPAPGPVAPAGPVAEGRHRGGHLVLELDTGGRLELTEACLFGRGPVPTDSSSHAKPVAIPDTTMSVSKTHFLVRPTGAGVEVVDQWSTNGTFLVHDGVERQLAPGEPQLARPGDVIRFGDRTMTVQQAVQQA
jgi:hypothetical protein